MSAIKAAKSALRHEIEMALSILTMDQRAKQSAAVARKLYSLAEFKNAKRVSVFLSLDTEINTEPIIRKIFEENKECFVPRYSKAGMEMVKLNNMDDWASLPVTKWNIKQPLLKEQRENALETGGLDLIIVPGVAFTKEGLRLGHGAGYYDKFLTKLKASQSHPVGTVAVGFKEQIVDTVPVEETDVTIDKILYADD